MVDVNGNGLTLIRWLRAARVSLAAATAAHHDAWQAGEDPAEHARAAEVDRAVRSSAERVKL